jgi:gluconolactonase
MHIHSTHTRSMHIDVLADGLGFTEGPVSLPDGRVACTSISHGCVYLVDPAGAAVERIDTGGGPNGLALGPDAALYVAQNGGVFGASGPAQPGVQVIRDGRVDYLAEGMGAPNDLVIGPDRRLWVTDTRAEVDVRGGGGLPGWVWAVDIATGATELVIDQGPVFINGLAFTPDNRRLLVTVTLAAQLLAYDTPAARQQAVPRLVHTFDNGWPDGMAVTDGGDVWVAMTAADRLDAIASTGPRVATVALPAGSLPTNVCLGADNPGELFVTAAHSQSLLRLRPDKDSTN